LKSKNIFFSFLAGLLILMILGGAVAVAEAQPVTPTAEAGIKPTSQIRIPPPQVRTRKQREAAAAREAAAPSPPGQEIPFRPTKSEAAYKAGKVAAARQRALQSPGPGIQSPAPLAPTPLTGTINFGGVNSVEAGNFIPPDTHGAVGLNHFVEITNSHLDIYEKGGSNTRVYSQSLSVFFGDVPIQRLYDPRVIYDHNDKRWIMSALAPIESSPPTTVQRFFFAVSLNDDPTGDYYIYQVSVSNGYGDVWDFPQLGLDRHAVIFTANHFDSLNNFIDARMFAVAKSLLYNGPGQTLTPSVFTGLAGTLSPPLVLDENPNTYLVAADSFESAPIREVMLYTLTNSAADSPTLSTPATIPVQAYTMPANAPQPGTNATLDTSDCRFVSAGTQIGNSLFQVHTIAIGGLAKCRFYEFDTVNRKIIQTGTFGRSNTSSDFNATIVANRRKDVFVTWSSTDVSNNVNAEVRYSGRLHTEPLGVIPSPGSWLVGSNTFYNADTTRVEQRWGDYSAVSLDPVDPRGLTAWIVNERILSTTNWGSRIGCISLPPYDSSLPAVYLLLLSD
jgi:hypothetical protein